MLRNLQFASLFGIIFGAVLILILVPEAIPTYTDALWIMPAMIAALFALRYFTIWMDTAQAAGGRMVDKAFGGDGSAAEGLRPGPESYLQMLTGLAFVGPWVTLFLAGVVPFALAIGLSMLVPEMDEWQEDLRTGAVIAATGLVAIPWLLFLQRWGGVRPALPIVPIPILWLAPIVVVGGIVVAIWQPSGDEASVVQPLPTATKKLT